MTNSEDRVSAFLLPGEQIRWTSRNSSSIHPYQMIALLCGLYSLFMFVVIKYLISAPITIIEFALFVTLLFSVLVLFCFQQMHLYLIVTNQRVIQFCDRFHVEWRSIDLNAIQTCITLTPTASISTYFHRDYYAYNILVLSSREDDITVIRQRYSIGQEPRFFTTDPPEIVFSFYERTELVGVFQLIEALRESYTPVNDSAQLREQLTTVSIRPKQEYLAESESYIAAGEQIYWVGHPAPWKVFTYYDALFGLLFLLCCPSLVNYLNTIWHSNTLGTWIFASAISLIVLYIIMERYVLQYLRRKQFIYVVTNHDLLIINKGSPQPVIRIPLTALTKITFNYMFPLIGTIRFRGSPIAIKEFTHIGYAALDTLYSRLIHQPYINFAFYDIDSVSVVAKIIELARKMQQKNEAKRNEVAR